MAIILNGAPVAKGIGIRTSEGAEALLRCGVTPRLAILRIGDKEDDAVYERSVIKQCSRFGVGVRSIVLPDDVSQQQFFTNMNNLNDDSSVHGILMMRPLPRQIDGDAARKSIFTPKDVDGSSDYSLSGVFTNTGIGFQPCTAQAAMEILDYYKIDCAGKHACVIGRSLTVGRPVSMMLLHRNATVSICHTHTVDVRSIARESDILIACSGQTGSIGTEYVRPWQIVIDVGMGVDAATGRLCGDVRFSDVEPVVSAITPVPGGVGSVTTAVLISHVVEAARRQTALKGVVFK